MAAQADWNHRLQAQLADWQAQYEVQKQQKDHIGTVEFDGILKESYLVVKK